MRKEATQLKCHGSAIEVPLKCCWSAVEVQTANSQQPQPKHLPRLTPPLSTVGWSKPARFKNLRKKPQNLFLLIVASQSNIRNTFFYQKSSRLSEVGVSRWRRQTIRQTDRHGDSMTESAERANSVKITILSLNFISGVSVQHDSSKIVSKECAHFSKRIKVTAALFFTFAIKRSY